MRVTERGDAIEVVVGDTVWTIGRSGAAIIRSATAAGAKCCATWLTASAQDGSDDDADAASRRLRYASRIDRAVVEQTGPIRAVVRVEGQHEGEGERWLPFSLRIYFHAGSASVRVVHSLIFDGDPAKRFVRGLGCHR